MNTVIHAPELDLLSVHDDLRVVELSSGEFLADVFCEPRWWVCRVPTRHARSGVGLHQIDVVTARTAIEIDAVGLVVQPYELPVVPGGEGDTVPRVDDDEGLERVLVAVGLGVGEVQVAAAGALVEALTDLGVHKLGFCSPYTEQLNAEAAAFLTRSGFEIVSLAYVGEDLGNYGQGALSPGEVMELALRADHPDAEALVLSCTDMRSVETVARLEAALGKPVVCSNQAMLYQALELIGLPTSEVRCGRLFQRTAA